MTPTRLPRDASHTHYIGSRQRCCDGAAAREYALDASGETSSSLVGKPRYATNLPNKLNINPSLALGMHAALNPVPMPLRMVATVLPTQEGTFRCFRAG